MCLMYIDEFLGYFYNFFVYIFVVAYWVDIRNIMQEATQLDLTLWWMVVIMNLKATRTPQLLLRNIKHTNKM